MEELRECKKHGTTIHVLDKLGHWRCRKCRVEAVQKRRILIKEKAIQYKGGKCSICGYEYEGEDIPDNFVCPICGVGKENFKLIQD